MIENELKKRTERIRAEIIKYLDTLPQICKDIKIEVERKPKLHKFKLEKLLSTLKNIQMKGVNFSHDDDDDDENDLGQKIEVSIQNVLAELKKTFYLNIAGGRRRKRSKRKRKIFKNVST